MKIFNLVFLFLAVLLVSKNDIVINEKLDVNKTEIKFGKDDNNFEINCSDIIKGDTINIFAGKTGFGGYTFKLQLIGNTKNLKIVKWTDYNAYDGKSSFDLPLKSYTLELNKDSYKTGDTLKAKFKIKTDSHKFQKEKIKITGELYHIIGGNYFKWHYGGASSQVKAYKNGKFQGN